MGQYWYLVNLEKKEFVHPHRLGSGVKLGEQLGTYPGTGAACIVLLAAGAKTPRGGGDIRCPDEIGARTLGRWAGDRVAFVGDYAEDGDLPVEFEASKVYGLCGSAVEGGYKDITEDVAHVIEKDLDGKFVGDGWRDWVQN